MKNNTNNDTVDLFKIIFTIMVIMIHSSFLGGLVYPSVRVAVPCFFILSSYFTFKKINTDIDFVENKKKISKIIARYMKLYLFWFIVLLPLTLYIRKYFSSGIILGIIKFLKSIFLGSTFPGSWYLMATIISIIIIFLLSNIFSNKNLLIFTIPIYLYSTFMSEFYGYILNDSFIYTIYDNFTSILGVPCFNFQIALLYIVIGKIISEISMEKIKYNRKKNIIGFLFSLILLIIEYSILSLESYFIYNCDCFIFLAPLAYFLVMIILSIKINIKHSKIIRSISTIGYCSHIPIIIIINKLFINFGFNDYQNVACFFLTCLLVFVESIIILILENKFSIFKYAH